MFKKKESLNKREEELMNYLWEIKKPMTTNEMAKQLLSLIHISEPTRR